MGVSATERERVIHGFIYCFVRWIVTHCSWLLQSTRPCGLEALEVLWIRLLYYIIIIERNTRMGNPVMWWYDYITCKISTQNMCVVLLLSHQKRSFDSGAVDLAIQSSVHPNFRAECSLLMIDACSAIAAGFNNRTRDNWTSRSLHPQGQTTNKKHLFRNRTEEKGNE